MKLLTKLCAVSMACPSVLDPEDGSGDIIIIGEIKGEGDYSQLTGRVEPGGPCIGVPKELIHQYLEASSGE